MGNFRHHQVACTLRGHACSAACLPAGAIRHSLSAFIEQQHSAKWCVEGYVCRPCLNRERTGHLVAQLEQERGALSAVEAEVSKEAAEHSVMAAHIEDQFQRDSTVGQRMADAVASVGGSWPLVVGSGAVMPGRDPSAYHHDEPKPRGFPSPPTRPDGHRRVPRDGEENGRRVCR